ncbi:MAG TPA: clostripain-related cysteine peptidase [Labilithrix sp.]|nr:clostripain-related cysteine peptidase [Labilithrix sp.]
MVRFKFLAHASLPVLLATLSGCTVGTVAGNIPTPPGESEPSGSATASEPTEETTSTPSESTTSPASWTIFVYANGDNDRSQDLAADIARMNQATLGTDVKVVVLADWNANLKDAKGDRFATGTDWSSLSGNGQPATTKHEAEKDLDDPAVLRTSVARAFKENPARHYGLIMWTRAEGGDTQDGQRPGASAMSTTAMISAIRDGANDAGLTGDRPLDMLGFDFYSPGRIEVAYAMKSISRVYIATAAKSHSTAWAYADALSFLSENPEASPATFVTAEATAAKKSGTRSHLAIETTKLESLATSTSSLVNVVISHPEFMPRVIAAAYATALRAMQNGRPPSYNRFVHELATNGEGGALTTAAESVATHLDEALLRPTGDDAEVGITLPFAWTSPSWAEEYLETAKDWRQASGWDALAESFSAYDPKSFTP